MNNTIDTDVLIIGLATGIANSQLQRHSPDIHLLREHPR